LRFHLARVLGEVEHEPRLVRAEVVDLEDELLQQILLASIKALVTTEVVTTEEVLGQLNEEEDVSALKSTGAPLITVEAHIETAEGKGVVGTVEVVEVIYDQEVHAEYEEFLSSAKKSRLNVKEVGVEAHKVGETAKETKGAAGAAKEKLGDTATKVAAAEGGVSMKTVESTVKVAKIASAQQAARV
jgi:hypothetical protein